MNLEDYIQRELGNIEMNLKGTENWDDEILRNYLLGWKDALQEIQNEMGKRV